MNIRKNPGIVVIAAAVLLISAGLVGCENKGDSSEQGSAAGEESSASAGSTSSAPTAQNVNETIGCEGASMCAKALEGEQGQPLSGFQSRLDTAASWEVKADREDVKEEQCNQELYILTRNANGLMGFPSLPEVCRFDGEQLWQALGGVHDHCDGLKLCAQSVYELDPDGEAGREAQALMDSAKDARTEGHAGEMLCSKLIDAAIDKGWGYDSSSGRCYLRPDGYLYMNQQAVLKWTGAAGEADQNALVAAFKQAPQVADAYVSGYGAEGSGEFELTFKPEGELDAAALETWAAEEGNLDGWELVELIQY